MAIDNKTEEVLGSGGQVFVLLHGWGCTLNHMRPLAKLLATFGQVHSLTLPGFGGVPMPGEVWGSREYADYVHAYLKSNALERPVMAGHSFGGRVCVQLAGNYPDAVGGLVLIASAGIPTTKTLRKRVRLKYVRFLGKSAAWIDFFVRTRLKQRHEARFGSVDYRNAGLMRPVLVKVVNEDLSAVARTIQTPALLLWGEHDTETPCEMGRKYSELISGADLVILPGAGHVPFGTMPDLCATYIKTRLMPRLAHASRVTEDPACDSSIRIHERQHA
ncbi:MAG: alpha/beta hydrolase [Candidatus Hydrogenedentes bacterium]|nr:alpha/beta hydrolase [Candidatus Hydrogenedentota bacterium]